ncbi:3-hydroxyacyl-CoA dehydrogenase [Paucimonas lemoignei]|uniref:3-hydroxyacyl-CoA dehydrogenase n=1 Tax=Paucimonas lemoignei TaxID=29443 RepID=A0A4R3I055_PAULE|nr:3-hydroxyacyl-CoA dehydrogenase [Paucimonas lemoignei]TCS39056.1 3-hydroxyacyl-CoA dehydrogenase [Paucimonas lemoignei]
MTFSFEANRPGLTLGIVGAGIMGRGIAQIAAEAGITVLLADARAAAVEEAQAFCADIINKKAAKGKISESEASAAIARIQATDAGPDKGYAAFAGCDVVIEAAAERLDIKHAVLRGVEAAVSDRCIIATNTSSLSVTSFAAAARIPARVAGFHFFNPVPLMKIVEVIGGVLTEAEVIESLVQLAQRLGHYPVRTTDTPGFLVNHAGRAFGTEALRIVQEGIASFADIDRVMVEAAGFRMGPFELFDLTGLDVSHTVIESIYRQYYEEPRYRPIQITAQRYAAGLFGRKTGRGFYEYLDGKAQKPAEAAVPQVDVAAVPVWVSDRHPQAGAAVRAALAIAGARLEQGAQPSAQALIIVTPFGEDATTAALADNLDAARTVAIDCLFDLERRRTLMKTPLTQPEFVQAAHALFAASGKPVTVIEDSPGFIAQRIIAAIVNIGAEIAQQKIASPADINKAVELGLGYPLGPLALGDKHGAARILAILEAMQSFYGDPRYRPSPWLKRRALLGISLMTAC